MRSRMFHVLEGNEMIVEKERVLERAELVLTEFVDLTRRKKRRKLRKGKVLSWQERQQDEFIAGHTIITFSPLT